MKESLTSFARLIFQFLIKNTLIITLHRNQTISNEKHTFYPTYEWITIRHQPVFRTAYDHNRRIHLDPRHLVCQISCVRSRRIVYFCRTFLRHPTADPIRLVWSSTETLPFLSLEISCRHSLAICDIVCSFALRAGTVFSDCRLHHLKPKRFPPASST